MRTDQIKTMLGNGFFAVKPSYLKTLLATVNSGVPKSQMDTNTDVTESHGYEVINKTAVIVVDGAMVKKNDMFSAMCGGFIGYDTIASYIDKAEADSDVDRILFKVDTVGGDVNGVDQIGERIFNSSKPTVTYYNNIGASAGIWAFSGADEIYASKTTLLGSIGVISTYSQMDDTSDSIRIVSENAENKDCSLSGDCKDKIKSRVNSYESIFLSRVSRNTGLSEETVINGFNKGDVILADEAKTLGFIKDVLSYDKLLHGFNSSPTASLSDKTKKTRKKGNSMDKSTYTQSDMDAIQANLDAATENLQASEDSTVTFEATIVSLKEAATAQSTLVSGIVAMAFEHKVSKSLALDMLSKPSIAEAGLMVLSATTTAPSVIASGDLEKSKLDETEDDAEAMIAYAKSHTIKG